MSGNNIVKYAPIPGLTTEDPVGYCTTWGLRWCMESTKKSADKLYDSNPQNLKMFMERLSSRVAVSGWKIITKIKENI